MIVSILIVMVLGTSQVGGVANVFKIADRGNRLVWFKYEINLHIFLCVSITILFQHGS